MADSALRTYDNPKMRRQLVTPEGVDLGLNLAGAGQRATAFILDGVIMVGILVAITLIAFSIYRTGGDDVGDLVAIIWLLGFFMLRNGYFIIREMGPRAATLGKRAAGLRVVARNGGRLTADMVIARNLMREIEVYLPLYFLGYRAGQGLADTVTVLLGLGWTGLFLFFPLFNKDRLRVGDLLAGTWVINVPSRRLTVELMSDRPAAEEWSFSEEQLDVYGIYELQTLEQVLREGDDEAMAAVSSTIRDKLGIGTVSSTEGFLTAYYEALRRRLERKLLFGRRRENKFDRG